MKILLFFAVLGHILTGYTDCLMTYTPNGKFEFSIFQDSEKMADVFRGMSLRNLILSMILGISGMLISFFGYFGLLEWIGQFSTVAGKILFASVSVYIVFGSAHHVLCGATEWLYVRMGCTEEAHQIMREFFRKTASVMYMCYLGMAVYCVTLFIVMIMGKLPVPAWECIFNPIVFTILLSLTKLPAKGNIAGALFFLALFFLI